MPSFRETAPTILTNVTEAERFVRRLDRTVDLLELAAASTALATLALEAHIELGGKDSRADAMLETAQWLRSRLVQLIELLKTVED